MKNYLNFSKKEGIATLILSAIVIAFAILPFRNASTDSKSVEAEGDWVSVSQILDEKKSTDFEGRNYASRNHYSPKYNANNTGAVNARLFNFDPNTASPQELKTLGLRERTIQILSNYRNKGGKFKRADDLQKIYGLRADEFARLKPFIVIEAASRPQTDFTDRNENRYSPSVPNKDYKRKVAVIDINVADTTAFQSLYGIGSKLAARIVNYRNKLGGFYAIEQVGETYGVPDSTFQKIKPYLKLSDNDISKININTASYEALNAHPYISSKLAYLIMKYRKDNGSFSNIESVKDLVSQTNDSYERVVNYLTM